MIERTPQFLDHLIMSDEAHFHLNGNVNKQNFRYWAAETPHMLHQKPLHSEKVTVWCGVSAFGVLGPYFFENATGQSVTVTSDRYVELLREFLNDELCRLHVDTRLVWFQQDGATAHTAQNSMAVIRGMFPQHVTSHFGDVEWPPRSPDLSACDFFLWGYLKEKVYAHCPHTIQELKDCIQEEIQRIPVNMLRRVMDNVRQCAEMCLTSNGAHLSDIIFKKLLENVMLFHVAYHCLASYDLIFN
jgi:hypothetical protein